jgi:hypothetical protein
MQANLTAAILPQKQSKNQGVQTKTPFTAFTAVFFHHS